MNLTKRVQSASSNSSSTSDPGRLPLTCSEAKQEGRKGLQPALERLTQWTFLPLAFSEMTVCLVGLVAWLGFWSLFRAPWGWWRMGLFIFVLDGVFCAWVIQQLIVSTLNRLLYTLAAISMHVALIPLFEDTHYLRFEREILACVGGQGITLHGLIVGSGLLAYKGIQLRREGWKDEADPVSIRGIELPGGTWVWFVVQQLMDFWILLCATAKSKRTDLTITAGGLLIFDSIILLSVFRRPLPGSYDYDAVSWRRILQCTFWKELLSTYLQFVFIVMTVAREPFAKEYLVISWASRVMNVLILSKKLGWTSPASVVNAFVLAKKRAWTSAASVLEWGRTFV